MVSENAYQRVLKHTGVLNYANNTYIYPYIFVCVCVMDTFKNYDIIMIFSDFN